MKMLFRNIGILVLSLSLVPGSAFADRRRVLLKMEGNRLSKPAKFGIAAGAVTAVGGGLGLAAHFAGPQIAAGLGAAAGTVGAVLPPMLAGIAATGAAALAIYLGYKGGKHLYRTYGRFHVGVAAPKVANILRKHKNNIANAQNELKEEIFKSLDEVCKARGKGKGISYKVFEKIGDADVYDVNKNKTQLAAYGDTPNILFQSFKCSNNPTVEIQEEGDEPTTTVTGQQGGVTAQAQSGTKRRVESATPVIASSQLVPVTAAAR